MATYYWVGGNGTWNNTNNTNWSASSGGAGGAGIPNNADFVNFDANSGTAAVVDVTATAVCLSCTINKSDINLSLSGSPTFAGTTTLTTGTITLNSYTLTTLLFSSNNSNTRSIAFGTGAITLTGNAAVIWGCQTVTNFSYTGTPTVNCTYAGGTGTRQVGHGSVAGATEANTVSYNITAGTDTFSVSGAVNNLNFTGFAGTFGTVPVTVYGDYKLSSGMTVSVSGGTVTFAATSGPKLIALFGKTLNHSSTFNGVGGTWRFEDDFASGSTRVFTLTNGTVDANGKNAIIGAFALGSGTKTLTLGGGTWTCAGNWNANTNVTGLTVSASTGTISMTSGSAKTFSGGGLTWPTLNQGGAGALTIAQSNTFANIANTVQPATVTLTAGTTQTVSAFSLAGTSGNLITLNTTSAGTRATLSDSSGTNSISYVSLKDIAATGGAVWRAYTANGNVDGGNNIGWDFNFDPNVYTRRKAKVVYRR